MGKSTLLHLLGMHDTSWSGEYELLGHKVHELAQKQRLDLQRQHVGFVFQDPTLMPWRTVTRNVRLLGELAGMERARLREQTLENSLEELESEEAGDLTVPLALVNHTAVEQGAEKLDVLWRQALDLHRQTKQRRVELELGVLSGLKLGKTSRLRCSIPKCYLRTDVNTPVRH